MNKFRQIIEAKEVNLKDIKKKIEKIVKKVTGDSHSWYEEDGELQTGDRVHGYDFGPAIFIENGEIGFWDEFDDKPAINKTFSNPKDFYKFFEKTLKASAE